MVFAYIAPEEDRVQISKISEQREVEDGRKYVEYTFVFLPENADEKIFVDHIVTAINRGVDSVTIQSAANSFQLSFAEEATNE